VQLKKQQHETTVKTTSLVWLTLAAILLAGCGGDTTATTADGGVDPGKTYRWKLVMTWPKNFPGLGTGVEEFASNVDRMSNGRLKIHVYGAGELVPALEVFDAVSQGTAEMGHAAAYYWKGKLPSAPFFSTMPFGMTVNELNAWLHNGGGLELWREAYGPFDILPFAAGNTGVQMAGWFNREINSMEDFRGLKMRIPGLGGDVIRRAGGQPINIPGGELYSSMQTRVIDALEWVGPYNDIAFGFHQVARYYYYPGWQEPGPSLELLVNKRAYEALPADLQAIVEVAARSLNQSVLDEYVARNASSYRELVDRHKVDVRPLPPAVLDGLRELSREVVEELAASDPMAARVYESQKAFMVDVARYHAISEEAYTEIRK
jgi:TRAP-type mannitol/chloroaromatic compound transport system substrate-binding protein